MANAFRERMMADASIPVALVPLPAVKRLRGNDVRHRELTGHLAAELRAWGWRYEYDVCRKGWTHPLVIGRHTVTQAARVVLPAGACRVG